MIKTGDLTIYEKSDVLAIYDQLTQWEKAEVVKTLLTSDIEDEIKNSNGWMDEQEATDHVFNTADLSDILWNFDTEEILDEIGCYDIIDHITNNEHVFNPDAILDEWISKFDWWVRKNRVLPFDETTVEKLKKYASMIEDTLNKKENK